LKVYVDPSVIVSLYSADANSVASARLIQSAAAELLITAFGELEVINAMGLRVFRKEASRNQTESALAAFRADLQNGVFQNRALTDSMVERAGHISTQTAAKLGTRTADLLHVAAAIELGVDCLYSFDEKQRKLARSLHLNVN